MTIGIFKIGSDNLVEVDQLKDESGNFVNNASVTLTITERDGSPVVGDTFPKAMGYVSGSNGKYRGVVEQTLGVVCCRIYLAAITATIGATVKYWEFEFMAFKDQGA